MQGKITGLSPRGFGFLEGQDANGETQKVFFHASVLPHDVDFNGLRVGDEFQFTIEQSEKGLRATEMKLTG